LAYYRGDELVYAGRVGTGFTEKVASELYKRLEPMQIAASPFAKRLARAHARGVTFVRPELVAEVAFRGWSGDGLVRHASFRRPSRRQRPDRGDLRPAGRRLAYL
jgi:bifunctional non-homologous end joining protein LigD